MFCAGENLAVCEWIVLGVILGCNPSRSLGGKSSEQGTILVALQLFALFAMNVCLIYKCLRIYRLIFAVKKKICWWLKNSTNQAPQTPEVSATTCNSFGLWKECIFDMSDDICLCFSCICTDNGNITIDHIASGNWRHAKVSVLNCFSLFCLIVMCFELIGCMCSALFWFELFDLLDLF